jgi:hypothetical protein
VPLQGHGREEGRGVGRAGTDLPAADRSERSGHDAVDDGSLFQRLWLEFDRQVGDGGMAAACVQQQVCGFQELLHAVMGHGGTSVAQTVDCVMRFSG